MLHSQQWMAAELFTSQKSGAANPAASDVTRLDTKQAASPEVAYPAKGLHNGAGCTASRATCTASGMASEPESKKLNFTQCSL